MSHTLAYRNGQFLPAADLAVSPLDAGFVWGATVTDRARTYGRRLYLPAEHVARFRRSCELCRVPQPVPDADVTAAAEQLVARNAGHGELVLVMIATPGEHGRGKPGGSPSLFMHTLPFDMAPYRPLLERGARLVTPATRHVPPQCLPPAAKMRSRMVWWIAEQEAQDIDPEASALLLDLDGHVTETAAANFLLVRGDTVISPPRSAILDGVSLRVVESLCGEIGMRFVEEAVDLETCYAADEGLLTSTPFGVAGVASVNGRRLPWPGPVLGRLHAAWSARVGCDIWR